VGSLSNCKSWDGSTWTTITTMNWVAYGAGSAGENSDTCTIWGGNTGPGNPGVDTTANYDGSADAWTTIDAELPAVAYNLKGAGAGLS